MSNPPYIAPSEFAALAPDVRDHEPRQALDGGPDGLAFYRRIAAGVSPFLKSGGSLLLEIGYTQEAAVRGLLAERPELEVGPTLKDAGGHPRGDRASKASGRGEEPAGPSASFLEDELPAPRDPQPVADPVEFDPHLALPREQLVRVQHARRLGSRSFLPILVVGFCVTHGGLVSHRL